MSEYRLVQLCTHIGDGEGLPKNDTCWEHSTNRVILEAELISQISLADLCGGDE